MKIVLFVMAVFLVGCTNPEKATQVLLMDGYKEVQITGYNPFACSEDDTYATSFVAKKNGRFVRGTVCAGWFFKGSTIRISEVS